jgi:hydroxyacylglutathione hydrolase
MKVEIIKCLQDNYSYLIVDEKNNYSCVVDPSEAAPIINLIETKNIKLKFILNTHHHHDHVGGNNDLKKKYGAEVVGFKNDAQRIPDIDILLENNEVWKAENFEAKIIHIPGHTSGHICFYFAKEKIAFTGDTLFSLGCGKIFEGTYEQMYSSLNKLKNLPSDTKVYCGHEYTLKNSLFCSKHDKYNKNLEKKIYEINNKLQKNLSTMPTTIEAELACNIFLRAKNLEDFSKLRDLKDNF